MRRVVDQVVLELKSDRRKLSAVVVLTAFGLLLWGRLLLKDNVPRTATASPALAPSASAVEEGAPAERPVKRAVVLVDLPSGLPRDLFQANNRTKLTQIPPLWTKSPSSPADQDERLRSSARAEDLRLEAVLLGSRPEVVINGAILDLGDEIGGYRLIKVSKRQAVLVGAGGVEVRLAL